MAKVGAQRAAELTGKSKSTIQRAMNTGKISYEKDSNNRRIIDVSELERVYGLAGNATGTASTAGVASVASAKSSVEAELKKATDMIELERMKMKIQALEDQLELTTTSMEDLRSQRDQWQKQAQQVLITSQYSQKQAEEYKTELKTREETARRRRADRERQIVERQAAKQTSQTQTRTHKEQVQNQSNSNGFTKPERKLTQVNVKKQELKELLDFQGLWKKIKGDKAA